jgi:hypothetical protein
MMPGMTRSASDEQATGAAASRLIDQRIRELGGWRGATLARMRALILAAVPEMVEEWKWMGTPVWSCDGIVCTGEAYTKAVKHTFAHGAALPDPARLFNASLEGGTRRAIDLAEGAAIDAAAFQALVRAAVAFNRARPTKRPKAGAAPTKTKAAPTKTKAALTKTKAAPTKTKAAPTKTKATPRAAAVKPGAKATPGR